MLIVETSSRLKTASREAVVILFAAIVLGFAYTLVMKKGLFLPPAAQSAAPIAGVAGASTPPVFIPLEEAIALHKAGSALFVDARHAFDFHLGHITGAINVPLAEFELSKSPLARMPKDTLIITYCDGADCNSSIELAKKLADAGFTNVKMFFGGWTEWQSHHLEMERSPQ
jgi:rhodanese-related sulfurtransferase